MENIKEKEGEKEKEMSMDPKKLILIHSEHLLNLTLTKTTLDLVQRLQIMFNEAYQKGSQSDDDQEQAMLHILNQTGYQINIHDIIGVEVFFVFFLEIFFYLFI